MQVKVAAFVFFFVFHGFLHAQVTSDTKSNCSKLSELTKAIENDLINPLTKKQLKSMNQLTRLCDDKTERTLAYSTALKHEFNIGSYANLEVLLNNYKEAIYPIQNKQDSSNLSTYLLYVGNNAFRLNHLDRSAKYLEEAIQIAEIIDDTDNMSNGYIMISILFELIGDPKKSVEYVKKARALNEKNPSFNAYCDYLIGLYYYKLKDFDQAIANLRKSERKYNKIGDKFTALNAQTALITAIQEKYEATPDKFKTMYSEAALLQIVQNTEELNNPYARNEIHLILAKYYVANNEFEQSEFHAKKAYDDAIYIANNETIASASQAILTTLLKKQNPENLEYLEQFITANKLLYNSKNARTTISLREKYDAQEKENQLLLEKNKNITYRQYIQLSIAGIVIIALLLVGYFRQRTRKKNSLIGRLQKQALQVQMNPHFMFNSLNSINNFIAANSIDDAQDYLTRFAKLMRVALKSSQEESLSIADEVQFLDSYLSLENIRNTNFEYAFEVDPKLLKVHIPPLLIQPILENSIVHGFRNLTHKGKLVLEITSKNEFILFKVSDNGWGVARNSKQGSEHQSFSAEIQKERLKLYSKEYHQIHYSKGIEGYSTPGMSVEFKLPFSK